MAEVLRSEQVNQWGRVFKIWFTCSSCGLEVHHGDKFCAHCGVHFG
jgi:hypothetical protein